jgi:hypothetical protein
MLSERQEVVPWGDAFRKVAIIDTRSYKCQGASGTSSSLLTSASPSFQADKGSSVDELYGRRLILVGGGLNRLLSEIEVDDRGDLNADRRSVAFLLGQELELRGLNLLFFFRKNLFSPQEGKHQRSWNHRWGGLWASPTLALP